MAVLDIKGVRIGEGRTKAIVSLMNPGVEGLLSTAARAIAAGADCLEWRADFFGALEDPAAVVSAGQALMSALPETPLIFTLRSRSQGGQAELAPERAMILTCAVITARAADLVDVEVGLGDRLVGALVQLAHDNGVHVIVSHHDFATMPPVDDMTVCLVHMAKLGADIPKLAAMSKSNQETHDLMRATALAREQLDVPLLTMAMGASGTNSRLSGEVFGSALTFCALGRASAPGQVELSQTLPMLEAIHRNLTESGNTASSAAGTREQGQASAPSGTPATSLQSAMPEGATSPTSISGHTHLVSLLGNPTTHSLSPAIHNLSFALLGVDAVYLCFDVTDEGQLPTVLGALRAMRGWDGTNVAAPYQQAVVPLLDEVDKTAQLIGAVNVIRNRDGVLCGYNTDGPSFAQSLREHSVTLDGARMVLLGCGGAGSAILVQAALDGAERIDVFCRPDLTSWHNAERLQEQLSGMCPCIIARHDLSDTQLLAERIAQATLLVNATSVGMGEGCSDTPVDPQVLRAELTVADTICHPQVTQLLRDARAAGCPTIDGLGMTLHQAAASERIWYDVQMSTGLVARAIAAER